MFFPLDDTIAALGSAAGSGSRGILRISGADSRTCLAQIFEPDRPDRWISAVRAQRHPGRLCPSGCLGSLPAAVYLWPRRRSYTGQPMAEIHTVGSPPLLEAVLAGLYEQNVRPARPGEFTLRAFLAGRIDLVQAEAVLGVIDADDYHELNTALRQLAGGISGRFAELRDNLVDLLADLEAGLDFVEEDIEFVERRQVIARLGKARETIQRILSQASQRMLSRAQRRVVIAGLPNAGKSTLFNALAKQEAALVSASAGTTRDYLIAELQWQQTNVELVDTAGWGSETDAIERQAQNFRYEQLDRADLILWCTADDLDPSLLLLDRRQLGRLIEQHRPVLHVRTKSDCASSMQNIDVTNSAFRAVAVSAVNGTGLETLVEAVVEALSQPGSPSRGMLGMTASRSQRSLSGAAAALERARDVAEAGEGDEIIAIEIRGALDDLGQVLGTVYSDDILDRVFSRFCIGK